MADSEWSPTVVRRPQYSFNDCLVCPQTRRVFLGGELQSLEPKPFDALIYLINHRHRVVAKDELLRAVWARSALSGGVAAQAVFKLRVAIGDSRNNQRCIRTVSRVGYQFVAVVTVVIAV